MTARFDILLVLLTAYAMLAEAHVQTKLSQSEGHVRTKRLVFNRRVDVKYFLHTRGNGGTPAVLAGGTPDVSGTPYSRDRPTKFIIHGFRSRGDEQWVVEMASALLLAEDANVFAVDWREGASPGFTGKNYLQARRNCRTVGQTVGDFVRQLGQSASMTHIIGHSLGAHASGFAGKATQSRGLTVARISGLDPAGPGFRRAHSADRLDRSDATFVDVIHTDTFLLGKLKPIGHVDFYPNEGFLQPGCVLHLGCSHGRAHEFYTESIRSGCQFLAYSCSDWETFNRNRGQCNLCDNNGLSDGACSVMGYPSINYPNSQGSMYLVTSSNPSPHCGARSKRDTRSGETDQCVQSLGSDMRQEIRDYVDSITDTQEMGMVEDFCSMYSEMDTVVANITAEEPNCGPDDVPVILEYIADGKYDAVVAWAEDKCPVSTSGGAFALPSATLIIALQLTAAVAVWGGAFGAPLAG